MAKATVENTGELEPPGLFFHIITVTKQCLYLATNIYHGIITRFFNLLRERTEEKGHFLAKITQRKGGAMARLGKPKMFKKACG